MINGVELIPQMTATNSGVQGAQIINEHNSFQKQLNEATSKIMTAEDVAKRNQEIKEASVQLEGIFLKLMFNEMWKTVPKNELLGNSNAMDIYRDMYNEEITKKAAEAGGIGLADFIYKQLTK